MNRFWLARHGATAWSDAGRLQGTSDVPLSRTGRAQADALAASCARFHLREILTSPLARARETADIVATRLQLPVRKVPALRELDYAAWTGRTMVEMDQEAPALAHAWRETPWDVTFAPGESLPGLSARLAGWLADCASDELALRLVVAHGHVIRVLLVLLADLPREAFWRIDVLHARPFPVVAAGAGRSA